MDQVTTPVTSSSLLDRDVPNVTDSISQNLVEHSQQSASTLAELDHTSLANILCSDDAVHSVTQLVMASGKKQLAVDRLMESSHVAAVSLYSLPSIMSLSTFTASSVDNNNISINCSFTNSSVDSRDDDAYGLHVTFDDDNRPQLRPRDGSQISTGLELFKAACPAEVSASVPNSVGNNLAPSNSLQVASVEVPNPMPNNPIESSLSQVVSETIGSVSCTSEVVSSVACTVSSTSFGGVCPSRTLSAVMSTDLHVDAVVSLEMAEVAECGPSVNTAVNSLAHDEIYGDNPLPNGGQIASEQEERGMELSATGGQTNAGDVQTDLVSGFVSNENVAGNSSDASVAHAASNPDAKSFSVNSKTDNLLTPPASDGQSSGTLDSNPAAPEVEPCSSPSSKSSPTLAQITPVRKSVRTHRNPLNMSEYVSTDLSPRRRSKATAPSKRLSLDSCNAAATQHTSAGTRSVPTTQPLQSSKPRKDVSRTKKQSSSSECLVGLEHQNNEKCLTPEQLPVKSDPKTTNTLNVGITSVSGELKRKRGRPRKNQTVVNGKTNVQLVAGGSWSSLNSKVAGDSSLGSIGLVSELFSVKSFTPASSQSSIPTNNDSIVSKECNVHVPKSDLQSVSSSKPPSPVADLSFSPLDDLGSLDQKHKKKKKKRKKKKKSRHSSLVEASKSDPKVGDNLDGLTEELKKVQLSSSDVICQSLEHSEQSLFDGHCVLAKIFAQACRSQNAAALQHSFVVCDKTLIGTSANVPSVVGNRSKTGRKASPLVSGMADTETKQSCLPPKKRHKLQMVHSAPQNADISRGHGIGRGRRGRPPKLHTSQLRQKTHLKTSKFCSMSLIFIYHIITSFHTVLYI